MTPITAAPPTTAVPDAIVAIPGQVPCKAGRGKAGRDARGRFAAAPPRKLRERQGERVLARAEAAALVPWKLAIAQARIATRQTMHPAPAAQSEKFGQDPIPSRPPGSRPGDATVRPGTAVRAGLRPGAGPRRDGTLGQGARREDPGQDAMQPSTVAGFGNSGQDALHPSAVAAAPPRSCRPCQDPMHQSAIPTPHHARQDPMHQSAAPAASRPSCRPCQDPMHQSAVPTPHRSRQNPMHQSAPPPRPPPPWPRRPAHWWWRRQKSMHQSVPPARPAPPRPRGPPRHWRRKQKPMHQKAPPRRARSSRPRWATGRRAAGGSTCRSACTGPWPRARSHDLGRRVAAVAKLPARAGGGMRCPPEQVRGRWLFRPTPGAAPAL
jgi:hypothetical protein